MLALAVTLLVPLPALAGEKASSVSTKVSKPSIQQIVAREAARTPLAASSARREQSNPSKESTAFFKTKAGMVALAVMAVGAGYAIYSASHDRITSPAKQ